MVSKTRVRKAGQILRELAVSPPLMTSAEAYEAEMSVLAEWRQGFQAPLTKVTMGLRSAMTTVGLDPSGRVAQRLKREPQIVNKLCRFQTMKLDRIEDIAGCRAVLPTLGDVRKVQNRLVGKARQTTFGQTDDYVQSPKSSGYRAVHLHAVRDDRRVEVQLRTARQHQWADLIEDMEAMLRCGLKDGRGPNEALTYFRVLGDTMSHIDEYGHVSSEQRQRMQRAAATLTDYLRHGYEGP